ncbi:hypothetical protein F441_20208 [Phytophthora nicotianae CJ01A1]|uniref:Uncharacterized protein n=1 Tax=Phytophthora nicotianae CJ01A1 TaxID=1317063 RepID=W2VZJ3_PHYNI|nr:hypothetical protein F441_20208 [Phytophthora nicotianae CJ01A1]
MTARLVWFQFVDREGVTMTRVDYVLETNVVAFFLDVAYSKVKAQCCWIPELIPADLRAFANEDACTRQQPLDMEEGLGCYGIGTASSVVVEVPKIWIQFVTTDSATAFEGTRAAWLPLREECTVEQLKHAVKREYQDSYMKGILVSELGIYKDSTKMPPLAEKQNWDQVVNKRTVQFWCKQSGTGTEAVLAAIDKVFSRVKDTLNLIDGHFGCLEDFESFDLYLDWSGLLKGSEKWGYIGRFQRMENDILLYMTLMGDHKLEQSTQRPLHAPVHMVLKRTFFRDGSIINSVTKSNNGPNLETLLAGAVVLASHRGQFGGAKFPEFLGRLLYELGVVGEIDRVVNIPSNHDKDNVVIPFLSPTNMEWPNICCRHGMAMVPDSPACIVARVSTISILVFSRAMRMSDVFFLVCSESQQKRKRSDDNEFLSDFLVRTNLQFSDFYRISKNGVLMEFKELMEAKSPSAVASPVKR